MMKWMLAAAAALNLLAAPATASAASSDKLSQMFAWWNDAFHKPGSYTPDAFRRYFTEDATLVINGATSAKGVEAWSAHFNRIQSAGGVVEIVVPFRRVQQIGDTIYTYHIIRSRRSSVPSCLLASGYATLKGGKISSVVLVRSPIDPASDPDCWKD